MKIDLCISTLKSGTLIGGRIVADTQQIKALLGNLLYNQHLGYVVTLALKRELIFNSFNPLKP